MIEYTTFLVLLILTVALNAIMDSIDHHKGSLTLLDFWHIIKLLFLLILFITGRYSFIVFPNISFVLCVFISVILILIKYFIWTPLYKMKLWAEIDNTWKFSTGWPWLDHLFGFDKNR